MNVLKLFFPIMLAVTSTASMADQLDLIGLGNSVVTADHHSVTNNNNNEIAANQQMNNNDNNTMRLDFNNSFSGGNTSVQHSLTNNQAGTYNISTSTSTAISPAEVIDNSTSANNAIVISNSTVGTAGN